MAITSAADLLAALRQYQLLQPAQLDTLARKIEGKNLDARTLAQKLIEQSWLTPYQVNQLLQDKGKDLVLGSYILLERLGEGGMGEVFKAKHRGLGRIAALKVIRKERLQNENAVKRFHREVRAAAQLSHANIVVAYDADEAGGTHFMAMELVEGTDLNKLVKEKGALPVEQACDYIRQAALGLQHAFERNMVHRDIKGANLLLSKDGIVKILDMGLARMQADEDSSTLTQEGSVMGTLDYLAPEQAMDSHTVDIRADLYSLGCTFYVLLTGQVPFPGGTAAEKMYKHQFGEPTPVDKLRPDVPPGVAAVVRKLLTKKPEDRFQTPAELAVLLAQGAAVPVGAVQIPSDLAAPLAGRGPRPASGAAKSVALDDTIAAGTTPPDTAGAPVKKRRRLVFIAGGAGFLFLILVVVFLLRPGSQPDSGKTVKATPPPPPKPPEPEKVITNSIGMKLRLIPAGEFTMGSADKEAQRGGDEGPQHRVKIKSFYLGVFEVKQSEYEKVMGKHNFSFKDPDNPAENVIWDEALEFCKKLSELPDEKRAGRVYRLPTEAEWEFACRAGTATVFHYGDSLSSKQANFNGEQPYGGADKGVRVGKTMKCGSYQPNAWGLYDMHGNVWEWCVDGPRKYEKADKPIEDPKGPETAGGSRVLRGGSWHYVAFFCRSARRNPPSPASRFLDVGFRVVVSR